MLIILGECQLLCNFQKKKKNKSRFRSKAKDVESQTNEYDPFSERQNKHPTTYVQIHC